MRPPRMTIGRLMVVVLAAAVWLTVARNDLPCTPLAPVLALLYLCGGLGSYAARWQGRPWRTGLLLGLLLGPIGVIFGVEPWNFPYYQLARVVGPSLMLGNVMLVKHASNVPQCALAFESVLKEAGAPDGVYTNLFATKEQIQRLIADPRIKAGVEADTAEAEKIGVNGTPGFVLGVRKGDRIEGTMILGSQPISVFSSRIDALLKAAPGAP